MAISESRLSSSCQAVPGSCYNRNRPHSPAHATMPLSMRPLLMLLMMLAAMPTSCLALTFEFTTLPSVDIEIATTLNPPHQPANTADVQPTPSTVVAINETNVRLEPDETVAAEVADEFVHTSFVSLGGEGLEQGIRNAVKSEVESEIEADSSALVETIQAEHLESEQKTTSNNDEQTDAAQGVREPKTLETDEEAQPEKIGDDEVAKGYKNAENSENAEADKVEEPEKVEESEKVVETENVEETKKVEQIEKVEETVKVEQPEKDEQLIKDEDAEAPVDSQEAEKNEKVEQIVKDVAPDSSSAASEQEEDIAGRPLPTVTSDLVAVIFDENRAITEQPITKTNLLALEKEHEIVRVVETTPQPTFEVPKHQVTKKQGVEDLLPIETSNENAQKQEEAQREPQPAPEIEEQKETETSVESASEASVQVHLNEVESEEKEPEVKPAASSNAQPEHVEATETYEKDIEPVDEPIVLASEAAQTVVEQTLPEANKEQSELVEAKPEVEVSSAATIEPNSPVAVQPIAPSTTAAPAESEAEKDDESVEDDSRDESDAEKNDSESQTEQVAVEPADKDSSEESEEQSKEADERKARAEDSTATPLVSYPPHNAGQTFDNNLADERSAQLSRTFTDRSTLIIALCSGTAVLFIVVSLVIFVFSFQRQHGTLDIEMQEQRLGKDDLDQEDAQMKLLDVELSTPVIIAMGNEETDECL